MYDNTIVCGNCGTIGHVYKNCNHPITSYGVIVVKICFDRDLRILFPKYLLVQRKDSLAYVEFIRGKYNLENKTYILKLLSNMTEAERQRLTNCHDFETLWKQLWQVKNCSSHYKEFNESRQRFMTLKKGYYLRNTNGVQYLFNLDSGLGSTKAGLKETEWGFPKGRRNVNESDIACAMREFHEETGIPSKHIAYLNTVKPFEEVFCGSNYVRYKHVYFAAVLRKNTLPQNETIGYSCKEIKRTQWFNYDDVMNRLPETNVERRELFRRVHQVIEDNLYSLNYF
jgi:8-oxo-dGTP pyrophosphatase MutT (NUDIX family)